MTLLLGSRPVQAVHVGDKLATAVYLPRQEYVSELVRNLLVHPSFEVATDSAPVRTNAAVCPRATAYGTAGGIRWQSDRLPALGAYSLLTGTEGPSGTDLTTATRLTVTTAGTGLGFNLSGDVDATSPGGLPMAAAAGEVWTISCWVRYAGTGVSHAVAISTRAAIDSATWAEAATVHAHSVCPSGQWVRLSATVTIPAQATALAVTVLCAEETLAVGDTVDGTGLLAERTPMLGSYFDGAVQASPDPDLTTAWSGPVGASSSTLRGTRLVGVSTAYPDRALTFRSGAWAVAGDFSARVVPVSATVNASYAELALTGLTAGVTYTVVGTIRLAAALAGQLHPASRGLWVTGGGDPGVTYSQTAPNAAGEHEVRGTFTATDASHGLRLMNGASLGNGDVWWDGVALVEGSYAGRAFDGDSPLAAWDGVRHGSASHGLADPALLAAKVL